MLVSLFDPRQATDLTFRVFWRIYLSILEILKYKYYLYFEFALNMLYFKLYMRTSSLSQTMRNLYGFFFTENWKFSIGFFLNKFIYLWIGFVRVGQNYCVN